MRWTVVMMALALSACGTQKEEASPYLSLIETEDLGPSYDVVFEQVEEHARCAGFHRASADLASGTKTKVAFYAAVADDAETAAIQLASAKIPKDLAADMVEQMASTHAARWSYLITANASSDVVKRQATTCFEMADEQEAIIREVVKTKYGFGRR
ncbi:MAG: hypothetical protein AAGA21_09710 [Pseudomonadota bacterium]